MSDVDHNYFVAAGVVQPKVYPFYVSETNPRLRNYYEVIFGHCRLFADYDLSIGTHRVGGVLGEKVMEVHTIVAAMVRKMLQQLGIMAVRIDQMVLTAHLPGIKESMHIVWRLYGEDGREIVFASVEEVRRFMAMCVNSACDEMNLMPEDAANPLFDHSKPDHPCIMDIGVYNEFRNFRIIHNVKADAATGKPRAWLSDPIRNPLTLEQTGVPATPLTLDEFTTHLVRVWPLKPHEHVLAPTNLISPEIKFYKFKPVGKAGKTPGPAAAYKLANTRQTIAGLYADASLESSNSAIPSLARLSLTDHSEAMNALKKFILGYINFILPSEEHNIMCDTDHGFTINSDTLNCVYKDGGVHRTAPGIRYVVTIEWPLPVIKYKCFKTHCIARMETEGDQHMSLEGMSEMTKNEYSRLVWAYLNEKHA